MKLLMPLILTLAVSCAYGIPMEYMYGIRADFVPCSTVDSLQTLWPDWNNRTIFHQCRALNLIGTHRCPEPLWFSFWHQVCVWDWQWISPPPANEITPFPTTQWPPADTSPVPTTELVTDPSIPTLPPPTTTTEDTTQLSTETQEVTVPSEETTTIPITVTVS